MEVKSINILFQGKEKILNINPEEYNTFESFIEKIKNEFNANQIYQLMAMNSSEQFLILTSDNYMKILNEKIPGGLKIFMSEMVTAPDNTPEPEIEIKEEIKNDNDDDFIIENELDDNNLNIEQEKIKIEKEEKEKQKEKK